MTLTELASRSTLRAPSLPINSTSCSLVRAGGSDSPVRRLWSNESWLRGARTDLHSPLPDARVAFCMGHPDHLHFVGLREMEHLVGKPARERPAHVPVYNAIVQRVLHFGPAVRGVVGQERDGIQSLAATRPKTNDLAHRGSGLYFAAP